mgnify:CR=1 FL=1
MKKVKFGETTNGLPIIANRFGNKGPKILILGGVHGDEWEGVVAAKGLQNRFLDAFPFRLQLTLVPMFNLDGILKGQRKNANKVDLNRNLPTTDWTKDVAEEKYFPGEEANSEPENRALVEWLDTHHPQIVISLHSWKPLLNINGRCEPEAEVIAKLTGYEVKESIGYPTPGCLGTYCGLERDMPTLTYEIERNMPAKRINKVHVPAILEALKVSEERL